MLLGVWFHCTSAWRARSSTQLIELLNEAATILEPEPRTAAGRLMTYQLWVNRRGQGDVSNAGPWRFLGVGLSSTVRPFRLP
jgi:hypothetical protein